MLFVGPPGLGKTTLAQIVSRELGVNFRATSGPVIAKAGDLAALLTNLEERDVLFIDEIHRLNPAVEEILYPAMEDFQLDLIIGEGPAARSVKIDLAKFTLVGATTRAGLLTNPLRDRFGIPIRLNFYTEAELELIVNRGARVLGIGMTDDGANEIARRSRGTPRIAGRLLRRVRDFAHAAGEREDRPQARRPARCCELEVDAAGPRRHGPPLSHAPSPMNYGGGPVGVETLAAALSEPRDAIEEIIEPFLIQKGFLQRTPRGRLLTVARLQAPRPRRAGARSVAVRPVRAGRGKLIEAGRSFTARFGRLVPGVAMVFHASCDQPCSAGAVMSISARYVFIASMDVDPDKEAIFNEVYDTEHIPLLLTVPGVRSAAVSRVRPSRSASAAPPSR